MNVTVNGMFVGLDYGSNFDVRLNLPSTFVAQVDPGICTLWGVNQVRLRATDPQLKEKWELIRTAFVSGRRLWIEIQRDSLTNSRCVFTYVGIL
jgi:hypothetical protein